LTHSDDTSEAPPAREPLFQDPRFDALRNALYHTERRSFLDLLNRLVSFAVIVLGAGVVSKVSKHLGIEEIYVELGVVSMATAQLVFDFGGQARKHDFLQRRYYELLSEIEGNAQPTNEDKLRHSAKLALICSEEPITMRALDAVAYNQALDATTRDPEDRTKDRVKVTRWQYHLRHFFAFQSTAFAPEIGATTT
jgi:hypothetical protein